MNSVGLSKLIAAVAAVLMPAIDASATIIYTNISQDTLFIGDRVHLTVSLVTPPGARIVSPETEQGFGCLIVKEWNHDRTERKSSDSLAFDYVLTTYSVEPCSLPPLPFLEVKGDRQDTLYSDLIPIRVVSVITAEPGDTIILKDIKPQQRAGRPSLLWLWILLCVVAAAATVYLARHYWLKSRKPPLPPPPKPPYEEAMEALARLESKQYLMKGMVREYVFELSEILKRYTGRCFDTNASDLTTEEMLDWIAVSPLDAKLSKSLAWFLDTTHPVKFAKLVPDADTLKKLHEETCSFIEKTKPRPEGTTKQEQKAS